METTRILLMSKGANGKPPGAESDALGRNLMDHLMIRIEGVGPKLPTDSSERPMRPVRGARISVSRTDLRASSAAALLHSIT